MQNALFNCLFHTDLPLISATVDFRDALLSEIFAFRVHLAFGKGMHHAMAKVNN
jgi:hypothetical protein